MPKYQITLTIDAPSQEAANVAVVRMLRAVPYKVTGDGVRPVNTVPLPDTSVVPLKPVEVSEGAQTRRRYPFYGHE